MTDQPDNTEWVLVKHERAPIPQDLVIGVYPTVTDATLALNEVLKDPQWFCKYSVEHREKA